MRLKKNKGDRLSMYLNVNMEAINTIGIIVTVVSTILCPIIAHKKGRSVVGWLFGGFFLGGIGLIIIICLPEKYC